MIDFTELAQRFRRMRQLLATRDVLRTVLWESSEEDPCGIEAAITQPLELARLEPLERFQAIVDECDRLLAEEQEFDSSEDVEPLVQPPPHRGPRGRVH